MLTLKWAFVLQFIYMPLFLYAHKSVVKTFPKGPVYTEGALITYRQEITASPHDEYIRYSTAWYGSKLFDIHLLKVPGAKEAINIDPRSLADQYFDINIQRENALHLISFKINLTCSAARGLYSKLIIMNPSNGSIREEKLDKSEFLTMKIDDFKIEKQNSRYKVGDIIIGRCDVKQCVSQSLRVDQLRYGQLHIVEKGYMEADSVNAVFITDTTDPGVSQSVSHETFRFAAHCSLKELTCRGSMDAKAAAPHKTILVENIDIRFCKSPAIEFAVTQPNGLRTDKIRDIKENEKWKIICKALVNNSMDAPTLSGPLDEHQKLEETEIPLKQLERYIIAASVDFMLKDCSVYGEDVTCSLHHGEVFKIPIIPQECATRILSVSTEIYNTKTSKRKNCTSEVELKIDEEVIISCHILVPKMVGIRRVNLTNANNETLHARTICQEDSLKRYLLTIEAIIPREKFQAGDIHKYTCTIDHAWAESEIILQSSPLYITVRRGNWLKTGFFVVWFLALAGVCCCVLDCFTTGLVRKTRVVMQRSIFNRYNVSQTNPFMRSFDDEETVFEQASVSTSLLKET